MLDEIKYNKKHTKQNTKHTKVSRLKNPGARVGGSWFRIGVWSLGWRVSKFGERREELKLETGAKYGRRTRVGREARVGEKNMDWELGCEKRTRVGRGARVVKGARVGEKS
jgi:hypothetical protein